MAKFSVMLAGQAYMYKTVEVDADNFEEAQERAIEGHANQEFDEIAWEMGDNDVDEVTTCEEDGSLI